MKNLPSGLVDGNLEVFLSGNNLMALNNGKVVDYMSLPGELREPFQTELANDTEALHILTHDFNIGSQDEVEEQFVGCRYGSLNCQPDFNGKVLKSDAPICDNILSCSGFNKVCKVPGNLTRKEYEIIKAVNLGKQDIEISFQFKIALPTVITHLRNIRQKLNLNNRNEIAHWAKERGIH